MPEEKPKNENDNQLLTPEKTAENETNDNCILDADIIDPSDYKFEHECIVKKEVKNEVKEEVIDQATDIIDPSNYKFKSEYIVKKEVIDQVNIKEETKE